MKVNEKINYYLNTLDLGLGVPQGGTCWGLKECRVLT
jgi:hypothetical protein